MTGTVLNNLLRRKALFVNQSPRYPTAFASLSELLLCIVEVSELRPGINLCPGFPGHPKI